MKVYIIQKAAEDIVAVCKTEELANKLVGFYREGTTYPHHYEYEEYEVLEDDT